MFHVELIYTCNMKENALTSCISYARSHRVESGVGAWYGLFTGAGEWVVISKNRAKTKVETHECVKAFKWQVTCVGRSKLGLRDPWYYLKVLYGCKRPAVLSESSVWV